MSLFTIVLFKPLLFRVKISTSKLLEAAKRIILTHTHTHTHTHTLTQIHKIYTNTSKHTHFTNVRKYYMNNYKNESIHSKESFTVTFSMYLLT